MLHQVAQNGLDVIDGDGEADALNGCLVAGEGAGAAGILGVDDADDLAVLVEQGAAGVAGVDGAIGLEQLHGGAVTHGDGTVFGADHAGGQGVGQGTQGVADGGDAVPHSQGGAVPQNHGREGSLFVGVLHL